MEKKQRLIGISVDPGVVTGIGVFDFSQKSNLGFATLIEVRSMAQAQAQEYVLGLAPYIVLVEDARKRQWYGVQEQALYRKIRGGGKVTPSEINAWKGILLGAGSVQRSCQLWDEFLTFKGIDFILLSPAHSKTKTTADQFRYLTGYTGKTNEHSRDAAMLGVSNLFLFREKVDKKLL